MTITLEGLKVSRGIAIGKAHLIERDQLDIPEYKIEDDKIETELKRFTDAVANAKLQLRAIREHIPTSATADITEFIDAHLLMLSDNALILEPERMIRETMCNAEWALKLQRDALVNVFEEMNDSYLRTRKDDIDHVVNRIQRILLKHAPLRHEEPETRLSGYIMLADDLSPADTVLMQHHGISGFATEYGGPTSHTAILARSLRIPAVVGIQQLLRHIKEDDDVILDGTNGVVLINPDESRLQHYRKLQAEEEAYYSSLSNLKSAPSITLDRIPIDLKANIELPSDFEKVNEVGAKGVGLYRTEFMFMNRETSPDEEEHYETYKQVIETLNGLPVTIRTLDLGADKEVDGGRKDGPVQSNPALGLRAVRLCLKEQSLFRPQLRAILRASAFGPVHLLIPMLSNLKEVRQVLSIINELKLDLSQQNIDFDNNLKIGAMIEVPAAAVCANLFAKHMDFLSIGTNDLIQYTVAIDRVNDEVNYLYDPLHPAVIKLIHNTLQAGAAADIPVGMCGEMAGDIRYTRLLLGLGLREFSVHPGGILEVKQIVNNSDVGELTQLAENALTMESGKEIANLMEIVH